MMCKLKFSLLILCWLNVISFGVKFSPEQLNYDSSKSLSFLFHGDWGWNGYNQSMTAYEMGVYSWLIDAKFIIALGDNFYNDGVSSTSDSLWQTAFHDIYNSQYLKIPWYPVLGNHDYHGNVDAQIERTLYDESWTMPSRYYAYNYSLPDGGSLCIVYIDTCLLNPEAQDTNALLQNSNYQQMKSDHLQWIDAALSQQNETATWLVVAGHYPVYSIGEHGDDSYLIDELLPILQKHKVHAYLSGHDHMHSHIYKDGINYFTSGGSGGRGPLGPHGIQNIGVSAATNDVLHFFQTCGFSFAEVDSQSFNVTFVDNLGKIRYSTILDNPRNQPYQKFGNRLPGLGVSANVTSTIILVPAILIALGIIYYLSRTQQFPIDLTMTKDTGKRIRLDVVDSSSHSTTALNTSRRSSSAYSSPDDTKNAYRANRPRVAEFRV